MQCCTSLLLASFALGCTAGHISGGPTLTHAVSVQSGMTPVYMGRMLRKWCLVLDLPFLSIIFSMKSQQIVFDNNLFKFTQSDSKEWVCKLN